MGFFSKHKGKVTAALASAALVVGALTLGACGSGGSADAYSEYAAAYQQISAKGGIDANITSSVTMDGKTNNYSGNFKLDNTNNQIAYEMTSNGETTKQYSDGSYLYVDRGNEKIKYSLTGDNKPSSAPKENGKSEPSQPTQPEQGGQPGQEPTQPEAPEEKAPEFDTSQFLNEFGSFLDAGKIKELGLLEPIPKAAVTKTTKEGDVYTLEVADSIVENFLNTMSTEHTSGDTVKVKDLKNFSYKATIKDGVVNKTSYTGSMTVTVPGSLMTDGKDAEYTLDFTIDIEFQNPGQAVSISLPDTSKFTEVNA